MITLHTLENAYDNGNDYYQFVQKGRQSLLESEALASDFTLREFLESDIISACLADSLERDDARFRRLLDPLLEAGDIDKLLQYAERIFMRDCKAGDVTMSRFGEWTFDTVVIDPPSLRELQDDVWVYDPAHPVEDWRSEVLNDDTTLGYWEWIEHRDESQPLTLVAELGHLWVDWDDVYGQDHQKHFDGENACLMFRYPAGDVDMVRWPDPNIKLLRGALQDARETGLIKDVSSVLLPSGQEFFIDRPYWKVGDHVTWINSDDRVCNRSGQLTQADDLGDGCLRIGFADGWSARVCEGELNRGYPR